MSPNYMRTNRFRFNENEPDTHSIRKPRSKYDSPSVLERESFWEFYKTYFSDITSGGYLEIITHTDECKDLFYSAGAFICKVVSITYPELDFEFTRFHKKLKSFHYKPGQIIVETPDGQHVPMYSPTAKITKEHLGYVDYYVVTQPYSEEFISICKKYAFYYWRYERPASISYEFIKKNDSERLVREMNFINRERESAKIKRAQEVSSTRKTSWTDDEIINLWRTTI